MLVNASIFSMDKVRNIQNLTNKLGFIENSFENERKGVFSFWKY
ncbi:hypothetical protein LEP1GSC008_1679 [Leptospira kirschneri serovar Bulgarica str. Nikolaevo]|uniref:Uncharacterized protein n=1 Tax=Leptospira kirschneri serovar Bulgarica str. Nikolaevo TaxID=1240687 RepID=M6FPK9_9LEPT|nr:hypothetical protein LEP1GSC008_1679 [Leptospira kirschneri serovar Bulgarica str. Nikolaevo]